MCSSITVLTNNVAKVNKKSELFAPIEKQHASHKLQQQSLRPPWERRRLACKKTFCTWSRAGCTRSQGAALITIGQASWLEGKRLFFSFLASQDTHAPKALLRAVLHFGACTLKKKGGKGINVPTELYNLHRSEDYEVHTIYKYT